jgi:hypothetical protein
MRAADIGRKNDLILFSLLFGISWAAVGTFGKGEAKRQDPERDSGTCGAALPLRGGTGGTRDGIARCLAYSNLSDQA